MINIQTCCQHKIRGFTLVEMMVVIAIMAILATVSWSIYTGQVNKNRRSDAVVALKGARQAMIQSLSDTGQYGGAGALAAYLPTAPNTPPTSCQSGRGYQITAGGGFLSCQGYYNITVPAAGANNFTITATPIAAWNDPDCNSLSIDQLGRKTHTSGTGAPVERCWQE